MKRILFSLLLASSVVAQGQIRNDELVELTHINHANIRTEISIPNFDQYQTLKCDFHIHTVFSDGNVWPTMRVAEAWQEGLDAIAITDHIEYRPHKKVVLGDLNESFKIAKKYGDGIGFMVIQGTEITRSKPLGHLNALFINDANVMEVEDPLVAIDKALEQGAFIQWNHPGWPDDKSTLYPVHEDLLKAGKIHAVEVLNYMEYYPVAFDWCNQYGIAPMANTDIHDLISSDYGWGGGKMRPMTLVFAKEYTLESLREALFAGRMLAFFEDKLAGDKELISSLIDSSLQIQVVDEKKGVLVVTNISDIPFTTLFGDHMSPVVFRPRSAIRVTVPKGTVLEFTNCYIGRQTLNKEIW